MNNTVQSNNYFMGFEFKSQNPLRLERYIFLDT